LGIVATLETSGLKRDSSSFVPMAAKRMSSFQPISNFATVKVAQKYADELSVARKAAQKTKAGYPTKNLAYLLLSFQNLHLPFVKNTKMLKPFINLSAHSAINNSSRKCNPNTFAAYYLTHTITTT
jgi:hypothetical protein